MLEGKARELPTENCRPRYWMQTGKKAIPGFSLKDCIPAKGDRVDAKMNYGNSDLSLLAANTVRLRFSLPKCELLRLLGDIGRL
jgi:hypothetical protein